MVVLARKRLFRVGSRDEREMRCLGGSRDGADLVSRDRSLIERMRLFRACGSPAVAMMKCLAVMNSGRVLVQGHRGVVIVEILKSLGAATLR